MNFDDVVKYLYCEDCGNGQFMIATSVADPSLLVFVYLDKHGYFNIFRSMQEYTMYVENIECDRICINYDDYPNLDEGVDPLDQWLMDNIIDIDAAFIKENNHD